MNLFKKAVKETSVTIPTAKDIHNEAFSIQSTILNLATESSKEIFNDKFKGDLASKLYDIGFTGAKNIGVPVEANKKRAAIQWYLDNNPQYKFIDAASVDLICNKYNLYLCDISDFIGEIPLKNQKEILDFKIKETAAVNSNRVDWVQYDRDLIKTSFEYNKLIEEKMKERDEKIRNMDKSMELIGVHNLKIIAPESEIDMRYKTKRGREIVKDPVVLQPVKWGYLIVTAWGDEASDESVVNEKMN